MWSQQYLLPGMGGRTGLEPFRTWVSEESMASFTIYLLLHTTFQKDTQTQAKQVRYIMALAAGWG